MKLVKLIFIACSLLLIMQCSKTKKVNNEPFLVKYQNDNSHSAYLYPVGELKIKLDFESPNTYSNIQYYSNGSDKFLITENKVKKSIDIYSVTKKELERSVELPRNGKDAIRLNGFYFHNFDSIFAFPMYTLENILLVDSSAQIKTIISANSSDAMINHASKTRIPTFFFNDHIYSMIMPDRDFRRKDYFNIKKGLEAKLSINGDLEYLDIFFPDSYNNHTWGVSHAIPCRTFNPVDSLLVYSFGIDKFLYVFDFEGNLLKKVEAGSDYINSSVKPLDDPGATKEKNIQYFLDQPYYGGVFFDKYRDVYYRYAKLPVQRMERIWENKPVSIIILDKEFEKIGETRLSPTIDFYPRDIFVSEEGLFISNNHPLNPQLEEDFLKFTKFELKYEKESAEEVDKIEGHVGKNLLDKPNWLSFNEMHKKRKVDKKNVLVYMYTNWCSGCKVIQKEFFTSEEVIQYFDNELYAVKFNGDLTDTVFINNTFYTKNDLKHDLMDSLSTPPAYPTILLFDKDLKFIRDYNIPEYPDWDNDPNHDRNFVAKIKSIFNENI